MVSRWQAGIVFRSSAFVMHFVVPSDRTSVSRETGRTV
jgi:hypothetical protein